jgi:hypothetical protein
MLNEMYASYFRDTRITNVNKKTRYGFDGLGIEFQWERDFACPFRPAASPTQPPVQGIPGLSTGLKRPGRGAGHLLPCSPDVANKLQ